MHNDDIQAFWSIDILPTNNETRVTRLQESLCPLQPHYYGQSMKYISLRVTNTHVLFMILTKSRNYRYFVCSI